MDNLINDNIYKYLKSLKLTKNTRLIVTDLEKTLYDNFENINKEISKNLLKYLLLNSSKKCKQLKNKKLVNIFEDNTLNIKFYAQIILPIKTKDKRIIGSVILLNFSNTFDNGSIKFIYTIKQNVEFYSNTTIKDDLGKFENNPIYNKQYINELNNIINESLDKLLINNNFKHLDELLYFKIDSLKNFLTEDKINLLDDILNLLEEKKSTTQHMQ